MSRPRTALNLVWHCVRDGQSWPGCGECWGCQMAMPRVFADARRMLEGIRRCEDLLHETTLELDI